MIKAILFDLGNVVIRFSFVKAFQVWAEITGMDLQHIESGLVFDHYYQLYEKNQISTEAYVRHISKLLNYEFDLEIFQKGWNQIFLGVEKGALELLMELKKNYMLYAISNTNELHYNQVKILYPEALSKFDKIYCSHEIGERKPDAGIFDCVLNDLLLAREEVLFVDDMEANIQGARKYGIHSIQALGSDSVRRELIRLGVVF